MLRDNLDAHASVIGVPAKLGAGITFAQLVGNASLEAELRELGEVQESEVIETLALAIAPSPSRVNDDVVERCRALAPAAIVEIVTFVSLMQLVHRLEAFYAG
jgi:hypothetical protein